MKKIIMAIKPSREIFSEGKRCVVILTSTGTITLARWWIQDAENWYEVGGKTPEEIVRSISNDDLAELINCADLLHNRIKGLNETPKD